MAEYDRKIIGRRGFLGLLATGSVASVAMPLAAEGATTKETRSEKSKARYRVTDDVKAYYRVNRYPARKE